MVIFEYDVYGCGVFLLPSSGVDAVHVRTRSRATTLGVGAGVIATAAGGMLEQEEFIAHAVRTRCTCGDKCADVQKENGGFADQKCDLSI